MTTAFQPIDLTLIAAASKIVATSALVLDDDDHDATVEIVARTLSRLSADTTTEFVAWGRDPEIAARIVHAALETEASEDEASIRAGRCGPAASPVPESNTVMITMIKEVTLPMAQRMLIEQAELCAHLSRLVESVPALSSL